MFCQQIYHGFGDEGAIKYAENNDLKICRGFFLTL